MHATPSRSPVPRRADRRTAPPHHRRWWPGRCLRAGTAAAAALAVLVGPAADVVGQVPVTLTAQSAGVKTAFPDVSHSFEYLAVGAGQFLYGFQFPGGTTSWTPWTMSGASGIAANNSGFTGTQAAPRGTRVALLQNSGSISTQFTFAAGNWRLVFQAAQRANFGTSHQTVKVTVGGTEVFEQEMVDTTYRTYKTRTFTFATTTTTTVTFAGTNVTGDHTAFVDWIELEPIADWNQAATWSPAVVPGSINPVVIPAGVEVAIRGAAVAGNVTVNGELVTSFENATLDTRWVGVSGSSARLEVGQERTPYAQQFTLTLLGVSTDPAAMGAGTKFLMAMDGATIDMHGTDKTSWSKLTSLANGTAPQTMDMTVVDRAGWAVGDEVVVAYTGHVLHVSGWAGAGGCQNTPYDGPRSQKRTITAIAPLTGVITLGGTLALTDHGAWAPTTHGAPPPAPQWTLDQRAEVGNLTRNVRIVGSASATGFGGHVMIMACCTVMDAGLGRFANVELSNMGQKRELGRYPMHWHMVRAVRPGQYLRNSSIHESNNRAITVHGSHDVVVERNVCFDTAGHAVFLEDGVEHGNEFRGNLVLATRKPASCDQMLPHDNSLDQAQSRSPASFWISNPDNVFVDNVAADSLGVGYWFALHRYPTGLSSTASWIGQFGMVDGTTTDLDTFTGNVAHSLKMGVDLHDSVQDAVGARQTLGPCSTVPQPWQPCGTMPTGATLDDPKDDDVVANVQWIPPTAPELTGMTVYGCATGLYSGGGFAPTSVRFEDCVLADNGVHVQFASSDTVSDSLLVHSSGHGIYPPPGGPWPIHGFEGGNLYVAYDGPGRVHDSHLIGYDGITTANLVYGEFGAARRHTNHEFTGLTFQGTGLPWIVLPDYASYPPNPPPPQTPHPYSQPFVWGIAIQDTTGCLSGGTIPQNRNSPFWPGVTPHTLIGNHPMMHLSNGISTPDIQTGFLPGSSNAWLSPFRWGHLQLQYFQATSGLLFENDVPPVGFVRRAHLGWPAATFQASFLPSAQMRQLPVIVRPNGTSAPECVYEIQLQPGPITANRVDVTMDNLQAGDVSRFVITHTSFPTTWTPTLRVNDAPPDVWFNGQYPLPTTTLSPSPPGSTTTYQMTTLGSAPAIDLRMVNPPTPNDGQTHRITITW
jgi:cell surface hyaluronidase